MHSFFPFISGSFAPASPNTIWKKRLSKENYETDAYHALMNDVVKDMVPKFHREVEYSGESILLINLWCDITRCQVLLIFIRFILNHDDIEWKTRIWNIVSDPFNLILILIMMMMMMMMKKMYGISMIRLVM